MLTLATQMRIYLHIGPTDMRKGFDGLCALVRSVFKADPLDGSLFLFFNRRRDRIKALWWDRDGLVIWYKRLEQGSFETITAADGEATVEIDATQLAMLLGGVTLSSAKRRKRYAVVG
jgi:transposase